MLRQTSRSVREHFRRKNRFQTFSESPFFRNTNGLHLSSQRIGWLGMKILNFSREGINLADETCFNEYSAQVLRAGI
jgi:hypothetical protein